MVASGGLHTLMVSWNLAADDTIGNAADVRVGGFRSGHWSSSGTLRTDVEQPDLPILGSPRLDNRHRRLYGH